MGMEPTQMSTLAHKLAAESQNQDIQACTWFINMNTVKKKPQRKPNGKDVAIIPEYTQQDVAGHRGHNDNSVFV